MTMTQPKYPFGLFWTLCLILLPSKMYTFHLCDLPKRLLKKQPHFFSSSSSNVATSQRAIFPIYYNDVFHVSLPPNHRFPMDKYRKVRKLVQQGIQENPSQLVCADFRTSPLATRQQLITTHYPRYVDRYLQGHLTEAEKRNIGFPWSPEGVNRTLSSVGGTVAAACHVISQQLMDPNDGTRLAPWAAHIAGGTHHAFYDYGEGFCVFSDIAVAANVVRERFPHSVQRILILDLDVHQGNGNAVLFQSCPDVFTFSMHCKSNYFSKKEDSDLDIELPAGTNDATYLLSLNHWLKQLRKLDFDMVFYQAGVDILEDDRLGRMHISSDGVRRRNDMVYDFCSDLNVPTVITMGGGYPRDDWSPILNAHANVYMQAYRHLSIRHASIDSSTHIGCCQE